MPLDVFLPSLASTNIGTSGALSWDETLKKLSVTGTVTKVAAAGTTWDAVTVPASTLTLTGTTHVTTATGVNLLSLAAPTITDASAVTVDTGATLYIGGAPVAAGSVTLTTPLSLWVDSGTSQFDGTVKIGPTETPAVPSASLQVYGTSNAFLIVRDITNDVEMSMGNASTTGVIGTQTNHSFGFITNNATRMTLSTSALTFADAINVATNATTGTQIATATSQKLGFWGKTPVIQYATTGTSTGFTAGAGTAVTHLSTFTGNNGATAYTIADIVNCLKLAGFMLV